MKWNGILMGELIIGYESCGMEWGHIWWMIGRVL